MTPPDSQKTPDIAAEMDKVASVIATARRMLDEGRMVDLSALGAKVEALCASAREAPAGEREALAKSMKALVTALDDLAEALKAQFGNLCAESAQDPDRARALNAYGSTKNKPED